MTTFHSNRFSTFTFRAVHFALALAIASFAFSSPGVAGKPVNVTVDQARILRLSAVARTIIVGNPIIADVNIQDGRLLVVMGKSTGATNMIALDKQNREIANINIIVQSSGNNSMVLYKGSSRISMNCSPTCERTLYVGDSVPEFEKIQKQISKKMGTVKTAAEFTN